MKDSIISEIKKLREIINEPIKQHDLFQRKRDWSKLCVCLDTIEDTETAISSYLKLPEFDAYNGGYLFIYGLLQALFVEQDAIGNLYDGIFSTDNYFKIMMSKHETLRYIRKIRNDSIGHPTSRKDGSYCSIIQQSVSKQKFDLLLDLDEGSFYITSINIFEIIDIQAREVYVNLKMFIERLEEEIRMNRQGYKDDKLGDLFQLRGYYMEKLSSCAYGGYNAIESIAFSFLNSLQDNYNIFYSKAIERHPSGGIFDRINYIHPKITHVFNRLLGYKDSGLYNNYDAIIMIDVLDEYLKEVEKIANNIDKDYSEEF